jgi:hypothetical protein
LGFLLNLSAPFQFVLAPLAIGIMLAALHFLHVRRRSASHVKGLVSVLAGFAVVTFILFIVGGTIILLSDKEYLDKQCVPNQKMDTYCLHGLASISLEHVALPTAMASSVVTLVTSMLYYRTLLFGIIPEQSFSAGAD